ncbi:MAG TPA: hypothetical protein VFS21_40235, partial [Roseiflexaceae bacterium]|nr:hypothetical protein [Roseiflexaceae bacterium]
RRLQKHDRKARPVLELLPAGLQLVNPHSWDGWYLVEVETSEVILSAGFNRLPDHVTEEITFEFQ